MKKLMILMAVVISLFLAVPCLAFQGHEGQVPLCQNNKTGIVRFAPVKDIDPTTNKDYEPYCNTKFFYGTTTPTETLIWINIGQINGGSSQIEGSWTGKINTADGPAVESNITLNIIQNGKNLEGSINYWDDPPGQFNATVPFTGAIEGGVIAITTNLFPSCCSLEACPCDGWSGWWQKLILSGRYTGIS